MSISGLFDAHSSMSSFSGQNWRSATSLLVECSAAQTNGSDKARQSVARLANRRAHFHGAPKRPLSSLVRAKSFRNHGTMIGWVASSAAAATTASHTTRVWYRVYGPESAPQITALATRPKRIRSAKTIARWWAWFPRVAVVLRLAATKCATITPKERRTVITTLEAINA